MLNADAALPILPDSEVNMEGPNNLDIPEDVVGNLRSIRCRQRFEIFSKFEEGFGDRFNDIEFLNYETGSVVKGAELRDAQTGCEIYERLGWDSADHNKEEFFKCRCEQFDEQLCFVSEKGVALSNIEYRLTLGGGRTVSGKTDNDGKTKRICSANKAISIEKAEFFVPENIPRCPRYESKCTPGEAVKKIDIDGIETNRENVGSSVRTVVVKIKNRPLTDGEITMARLVFKDSIDYTTVKVHNEEYLPFGFQDDDTAMTPNGEMYFNPGKFKLDFSTEKDPGEKIWFIHEMVHVWQYQLGYSVTWHGFWLAISGGYAGGSSYNYDSADNKKTLPDFNMEQQGDIIAHYFGAKYLRMDAFLYNMTFYERVLQEFTRSPQNAALLPK
jgi:hypothetical protein